MTTTETTKKNTAPIDMVDYTEGIMALAIAEARVREINHLADRATTELGVARNTLPYIERAKKEDIEALQHEVIEIMLAADELARKIEKAKREARA